MKATLCEFTLAGLPGVPYSQSAPFKSARGEQPHHEYEESHWREKMHTDKEGRVVIPAVQIQLALVRCAQLSAEKVKGKGMLQLKSLFSSCLALTQPSFPTNIMAKDVPGEWFLCDSQGKKGGSGGRVQRCFPMLYDWTCTGSMLVLTEDLSREKFTKHLSDAGIRVGLGRWSPRTGGHNGRFTASVTGWRDSTIG